MFRQVNNFQNNDKYFFAQAGSSIAELHYFDGTNYTNWKTWMQIFICSRDIEELCSVRLGFNFPLDKDGNMLNDIVDMAHD